MTVPFLKSNTWISGENMPHIHPPSKGERRWRAVSYIFCAIVGFYVLFSGRSAIGSVLGVITLTWGLMMLTALPAAVAVLWGRYRVESVLLPLFGSALAVSILNAWVRVFLEGQDDVTGRAAVASALFCLLVVRGLQLHRIVKAEPWITTKYWK